MSRLSNFFKSWIPGCTGMTIKASFRLSLSGLTRQSRFFSSWIPPYQVRGRLIKHGMTFLRCWKSKIFIPICLSGKPDFFVGNPYKEGADVLPPKSIGGQFFGKAAERQGINTILRFHHRSVRVNDNAALQPFEFCHSAQSFAPVIPERVAGLCLDCDKVRAPNKQEINFDLRPARWRPVIHVVTFRRNLTASYTIFSKSASEIDFPYAVICLLTNPFLMLH